MYRMISKRTEASLSVTFGALSGLSGVHHLGSVTCGAVHLEVNVSDSTWSESTAK
jgi:hypothetical protein